jgi:hypothetical protein
MAFITRVSCSASDAEMLRDMFLKGESAVVLSTSNLGPVVVSCVRCGALPVAYTILDSVSFVNFVC